MNDLCFKIKIKIKFKIKFKITSVNQDKTKDFLKLSTFTVGLFLCSAGGVYNYSVKFFIALCSLGFFD